MPRPVGMLIAGLLYLALILWVCFQTPHPFEAFIVTILAIVVIAIWRILTWPSRHPEENARIAEEHHKLDIAEGRS